ncbi:Aste57867_17644 [Aphanomyces stellatus]|uniref:Aste57867_17644 protein n=1 Tax=Aphanomyces stellatus TaxID=120398 RepID=A0A485L888_9STRA|nr:hypothetical protein As57867_017584 [Aphanomyces stellatus]VFT94395.1 Aste57867_17644 [Aphanomyces stellatus]
MDQEPGTHEEIQAFAATFGTSFPLFAKADVVGSTAQPVFQYLTAHLGDPKWNFTKYLVGRDGHPFKRYGPKTPPLSLEDDIESLLVAPRAKL